MPTTLAQLRSSNPQFFKNARFHQDVKRGVFREHLIIVQKARLSRPMPGQNFTLVIYKINDNAEIGRVVRNDIRFYSEMKEAYEAGKESIR